ncbi:hypothetical protein O6H91_09G006500 [Diphasiastrum complanatum]|uniref:Uncharacterized protein n=1 Tax=Diphasiastrum complanatum TaxID=34168 RepID=A0ACC2CL45_DIPCM|nr:hypothetical protein O6H91_09G006500 [Diphasiastrum complanatum]
MWTEGSGKPKQRFSYLLLEDGDHYIQDWIATCRPRLAGGSQRIKLPSWQQRRLKGRLRLCARSIFFDPDPITAPILMFPLNKVKRLEKLEDPQSGNSKLSRTQEGFILETTLTVKMKENGLDTPYEFDKEQAAWWFCLEYSPVQQFLQKSQSLLSISALSNSERDMVLQNAAAQREAKAKFDTSRLEDLSEAILLDFPSAQVSPLVREPGRLVLSSSRLYFQPLHNLNNSSPVCSQPLTSIVAVARRRHALRHIGMEVFFKDTNFSSRSLVDHGQTDCASTFFTFRSVEERDIFINKMLEQLRDHTQIADAAGSFLDANSHWIALMTAVWQGSLISNYEYLLYLNLAAGRSFCDLTQWPVMPWVLTDYESGSLDLRNPSVFRDLSKPIGALNPTRLAVFRERFSQMPQDDSSNPPFLYGTHYSTPGYVLYWLVRAAPGHMLRLQNGRFDSPDRLFVSLSESWESVTTNPTDLKELIPEFYSLPSDFLVMRECLNLGIRQNGTRVGDVVLPPWAKDPEDFILKHREALDCAYVSLHLHEWIDLIFGFKQQGEAALDSNNLFHPVTYEGSIDLEKIEDPFKQMGLEAQINEFGQAPMQLFDHPHPTRWPRNVTELQSEYPTHAYANERLHEHSSADFLSRIMAIASSFGSELSNQTNVEIENSCTLQSVEDTTQAVACTSLVNHVEGAEVVLQFLDQMSLPGEKTESETYGIVIGNKNVTKSSEVPHVYEASGTSRGMLYSNKLIDGKADLLSTNGKNPAFLSSPPQSAGWKGLEAEDGEKVVGLENDLGSKVGDRYPWHWMLRQRLSEPQVLKMHRGPVNAVLLSDENASESLTLYSAGQDGFVKVYSVSDSFQLRSTKLGNLPLSSLALLDSTDAYPIVLAGSYDNCVYAYSVDYGREIGKISAHDETISCVHVIHSSLRMATASWDATIKIWSMEACKSGWSALPNGNSINYATVPEIEFAEHDAAILSLDVEKTGHILVSGAEDGTVIAWDIRTPAAAVVWRSKPFEGSAASLRLTSDGSQVVVASSQGCLHILETRRSGSLLCSKDCGNCLRCCEIAGRLIIAGSSDGAMYFWPLSSLSEGISEGADYLDYSPIHDHNQATNSMSVIGTKLGAATLATASEDCYVHVYNVKPLQ